MSDAFDQGRTGPLPHPAAHSEYAIDGRVRERAGTATEFTPGFAARHDAAAHLLQQAFAPASGFAPKAIGTVAAGPKSFSPADAGHNPTAGWNPLNPHQPPSEFLDPVAAAHTAGFAEGEAAGVAAAQQTMAQDRQLLTDLTVALGQAGRIDRERVARHLRQTVMLLVGKLVGETGVSAGLLAARVTAATDLLADAAESALLRVNPADVALLEGRLPATLFAAGDAGVARGGFVLESASTVVEDGPELWLEQLAATIDRVAVPGAPC